MTYTEVIYTLNQMKKEIATDDLETTMQILREHEAIDFAIEMLGMIVDREKHFDKWAKRTEAHVCASCGRASTNMENATACPIEEHYALPLDGYCHLWEEIKNAAD